MKTIKNILNTNSCTGTVDSEVFSAGLVELTIETYPPEHGEAYVLFARQRAPAPDYTTKEINLSFSRRLPNDTYVLKPDSTAVRFNYVDNSDPENPFFYTQLSGTADLAFDEDTNVFSGTLTNAVVEHEDEKGDKTRLTLNIQFHAKSAGRQVRTSYTGTQAA